MKFKALLYCRDIKPYVHTSKSGYYCMDRDIKKSEINSLTSMWDCRFLNGYIPMECTIEVEMVNKLYTVGKEEDGYSKENVGYAIIIKDLHIFDELKKLYNYSHKVDTRSYMPIWEKPKKMMWCKDWCEDKGINGEDLILIPCTPEEIQRIANKEQTVLVRKTILKGMFK